ncbi:MAG: LutC/YkgG family protein [Solirubrobacteraceae bacterium]
MSEAREQILARIRSALGDVPAGEEPNGIVVPRHYRRRVSVEPGDLIERFEERLCDYGAQCERTRSAEVAAAVAAACSELGVRKLVIAPDLPGDWRPEGVAVREDHGLSTAELDEVDGVLSGCAVAIAETGTLVLDGRGASGRRAITLLPDRHICVVRADQLVAIVPEAIARVAPSVLEHRSPITFVSGPSATSDIELNRVEGVHGPRHLHVLIVCDEEDGSKDCA